MTEDLSRMLTEDNKRLRSAGCKLARAAIYVVENYDGLHRLSIAVSEWMKAVADEGGRAKMHNPGPTSVETESEG